MLGVVIGNDISLPRLQITKNLIKKYQKSPNIYLINEDARKLPEKIELSMLEKSKYDRIYRISDTPGKNQFIKFDKVLVDVECSHDGSLKHMLKYFIPPNLTQKSKKTSKNQPIVILSNKEKKRRARQKEAAKTASRSNSHKKTSGPWKISENGLWTFLDFLQFANYKKRSSQTRLKLSKSGG